MGKTFVKKIVFGLGFLLGYVYASAQSNCKSFDANEFVLNGSAFVNSSQEVTLTPDEYGSFGTMWSKNKILFNQDFRIDAELYFGVTDFGADGIAFVLQPLSSNAGVSGGGIGYMGISPSFDVEFDTFQNPEFNDLFNDHAAIMKDGVASNHNLFAAPIDLGNIEDGKWYRFLIEWTAATKNIKITFDGRVLYNLTIDLKTIFPDHDGVYWGFTSATGGNKNLQKVKITNYCAISQPLVMAPTGNNEQVFCASPNLTVAQLSATGNQIKWYASASGGTELPSSTLLVDETIYYASQTIGGIESEYRLAVKAIINTPQITTSKSIICEGENIVLKAGENISTLCNMNITSTNIPFGDPISGFTYKGMYNGHYYYVYNSPTTWTAGEAICRANGGYLVCINDMAENNFVSNLTNNNIWIGMFRDKVTGNFRWLDCMDISFTNWRAGEPNSGPFGEPYVQIIRGCSFGLNTWNNLDDNSANGSCYSDMVPILEIDPSIYTGPTGRVTTYLWSTGETTPSISIAPLVTTDYWVDVTINGVTCRKTMTITVTPKVTPTFTPVAPICNGSNLSALPTTSLNRVRGTWSPAINNTQTTTYTFTPDAGQCANSTTMTITVNPKLTPSFDSVSPICEGSFLPALPTLSLNGIKGSWTPVINNVTTTTYTFTPDLDQCANNTTLTVVVYPRATPLFAPVNPICSGTFLSSLPSTSLNGIRGTWSPTINNKETTTYTFVPDALYCAVPVSTTIEVYPVENIKYRLSTKGSSIIVEILNDDATAFEYSIDNIHWQNAPIFQSLPNDIYTLYIRNKSGCLVATDAILLLDVPNVITPNDDGYNDTWKIPGIEKYPSAKVMVFDRFGNKVLEQIVGSDFKWDGKYLSRPLPTGNYWFVILLDSGKQVNGNLLIKNRN